MSRLLKDTYLQFAKSYGVVSEGPRLRDDNGFRRGVAFPVPTPRNLNHCVTSHQMCGHEEFIVRGGGSVTALAAAKRMARMVATDSVYPS